MVQVAVEFRPPPGLRPRPRESDLDRAYAFAARIEKAVDDVCAHSPIARSLARLFLDRQGNPSSKFGDGFTSGIASSVGADGERLIDDWQSFEFAIYDDSFIEGSNPQTHIIWFSDPAYRFSHEDIGLVCMHEIVHACSALGAPPNTTQEEVFCYFVEALIAREWVDRALDFAKVAATIREYLGKSVYSVVPSGTVDQTLADLELNGIRRALGDTVWEELAALTHRYFDESAS